MKDLKFKKGDKVTISLYDVVYDDIEANYDYDNLEITIGGYSSDILDQLSLMKFTIKQGDFVGKNNSERYELEELTGLFFGNDLELYEGVK